MMLYPSIDSLLKQINSKYTLVTLSAKRARILQVNGTPQVERPISKKYVGVALEEVNEGLLTCTESQEKD